METQFSFCTGPHRLGSQSCPEVSYGLKHRFKASNCLSWWTHSPPSPVTMTWLKPSMLASESTCTYCSTGTGKTNICRPNGWAQVFLCTPLHQQYVKRSTCMDFGLLDLIPTQGKTFHTITMTKKEPNLPPSGRSPTSCLPSFSCCTECMGRGSPSWLCHTVPKNSEQKVPNGCWKSAPNQIE